MRVAKTNNNNNTQNEYPRLAPAKYSTACFAEFNQTTGILNIIFNIDCPNVSVEIYRNGSLVISENLSTSIGDEAEFDISTHGNGDYEIIIMNADDEDIFGSFTY